jgi:hypothetical protein
MFSQLSIEGNLTANVITQHQNHGRTEDSSNANKRFTATIERCLRPSHKDMKG